MCIDTVMFAALSTSIQSAAQAQTTNVQECESLDSRVSEEETIP
jgi:hypothetical protein